MMLLAARPHGRSRVQMLDEPVTLPQSLPVLPFSACDVMLPGELKQCHIYEEHLTSLLEHVVSDDGDGLIGQYIPSSHRCVPLLQIVEYERCKEDEQDAHPVG